jgi:bacterial/archaeal transporter family protein
MDWIVYSLLSTLFFGLWGILSKIALNHISFASLFIYDCLAYLIGGLIALYFNEFKLETNYKGIIYSLLYGAAGIIATLLFILAVTKGKASLVTAITAAYPCVTILLAIIFLNENLTLKQFFGIILSIAGVILITT